MKRLTPHRKLLLDRWSRNIQKEPGSRRKAALKRPRKWAEARTIPVPNTLKLTDELFRDASLTFLDEVTAALARGQRVILDFATAEFMHPCGTLVLLSHFDIWQHKHPGKLFATYPKDEVVEQLMQHLGVLKRFGLEERTSVTHDRVKYWHFHSGDEVVAGTYRDISLSVRQSIEHPEAGLFADCLNEAVANTVGHAYSFETSSLPPPGVRKWWMFSQYKDNRLFVAIYDCGVTIPESLRQKPALRDYTSLAAFKDSKLIRLAIKSERTRTKLGYRGKGLPEMLEFSNSLDSGGLSISSRRGAWVYHAVNRREETREYARTLPGTLVLWEMPFREVRSYEPKDDFYRTRIQ